MGARSVGRGVAMLGLAVLVTACRSERAARLALGQGDPARGKVVFALAGGCGCHTPKEGPIGAGGVEIPTPFGTFYSTNITSDARTGIGDWSDLEVEGAIRRGVLRGGGVESPVMPYAEYAAMADGDVRDLIAYLRSLPAAVRENREAQVALPLPRLAFWGWRLLFAPHGAPPAVAPSDGAERGKYLTEAVSICADCHTPRSFLGVLQSARALSGVSKTEDVPYAPNITSDRETGIGKWELSDIENLLQTGFKPDFDNVQGAMAHVIDGEAGAPGLSKAPAADLHAIAVYVKTVPPIHNRPTKDDEGSGGASGKPG
jgi:mono/diheme cytochrome c family protein